MPKIGLSKPMVCIISGEDETLGEGRVMAKAIKADIKVSTTDVKMFADDDLDENIKEFKDGTLTQEVNELEDGIEAMLLGQQHFEGGETVANGDDISPFVRAGFISKSLKNNVFSYKARVLMKVKYSIPDEGYETKGENTSFKSATIVGSIYRNKDGEWKRQATFPTESEAITWLEQMLNVGMISVASAAGTTTGKTALSVAPAKAMGNTYKLLTDTAPITLPSLKATVASTYVEWDGIAEIQAVDGQEVCVVEINSNGKVVRRGKAVAVIKE